MNAMLRTVTCVGVLAAVLGWTLQSAHAASASVSAVLRPDGSVVATTSGSFAPCQNPEYSRVLLQRKVPPYAIPLCHGWPSCTGIEDRGRLAPGAHEYTATAFDCTGSAVSPSVWLTIDNMPAVTVTGPGGVVTGPFDITGTATFQPTLNPVKGKITMYIRNSGNWSVTSAVKYCSTEACAFSYKDEVGTLYDMSHGGLYTVQMFATATGSGLSVGDQKTFSVDKAPTVTVTGPSGVVLSPFDITGTATFKPTLSATKGTIALYINNADAPRSSSPV